MFVAIILTVNIVVIVIVVITVIMVILVVVVMGFEGCWVRAWNFRLMVPMIAVYRVKGPRFRAQGLEHRFSQPKPMRHELRGISSSGLEILAIERLHNPYIILVSPLHNPNRTPI